MSSHGHRDLYIRKKTQTTLFTLSFQTICHNFSLFLCLQIIISLHRLLHFNKISYNFNFSVYSPNFFISVLAYVKEPKYPITRFFISRPAILLNKASIDEYNCVL